MRNGAKPTGQLQTRESWKSAHERQRRNKHLLPEGKEGFNKQLPDLNLAAPLEEHEFK